MTVIRRLLGISPRAVEVENAQKVIETAAELNLSWHDIRKKGKAHVVHFLVNGSDLYFSCYEDGRIEAEMTSRTDDDGYIKFAKLVERLRAAA